MFLDVGLLFLGLVLLYFGAEGLVAGSSSLAFRFGLSSLVIGLTIVAYGTSMPEMVVSLKSAYQHRGAISIGNVVGSNIFNIAVILGLSAVITPLRVQLKIIKYDTPFMIGVTAAFMLVFLDFRISRFEGLLLFLGAVIYTLANLITARKAGRDENEPDLGLRRLPSAGREIAYILGGLVLLVVGSNFLVNGAVGLARVFGISEAVIGMTIIAAGTSLPELATSVVAALRKESDIAIGNVVGSNIFNLLAILGVSAMIRPIDGAGISRVDLAVMLAVSLVLLPLLRTGFRLGRLEGLLLITSYGVYLGYLLSV